MRRTMLSLCVVCVLAWTASGVLAQGQGKGKGQEGRPADQANPNKPGGAAKADVNAPALEKAAREKAKGATDQVQSRGKAMREDVAGKLAEAKGKGAQQRMAVHMKRIAQLNRLRELAQQKGDQNMIARVDKLIAQENQVYDRKLGKMQGPNRAGGAMPRMNPPGAKGKADVNQPTQVKPPAQTPPAPVQEKAGEAAQPPAGQSNQPKP